MQIWFSPVIYHQNIDMLFHYVTQAVSETRGSSSHQPWMPSVGSERTGGCVPARGIPGSAVSTSTEAGRQQIAQDECGRDAFPDPASEAPPTGHVMCNMH